MGIRYLTTALAVLMLSACVSMGEESETAGKKNLLPDAKFKKADLDPLADPDKTTWCWYVIEVPSEATRDKKKKSVTLKGGKTFLHSSAFDVVAGQAYEMELTAEGEGKVSIESLWWTRYDKDGIGQASPHRTWAVKPVEIKGEQKLIAGTDTAPEGAKQVYIRIVVESGTITISKPGVYRAPAAEAPAAEATEGG